MSKFAPMTASLLARKGDAMPSALLPPKQPVSWARLDAPSPMPPALAAPAISKPIAEHIERFANAVHQAKSIADAIQDFRPATDSDKPRRLFVALSHAEYERLAIAAVKKGTTQHQIVHGALEAYFKKLAADTHCPCIAGGACGCETN